MRKQFVCVAVALLLCACIRHAFAMGEVMEVTKETQAKIGLKFTLVAEKVDAEAVLVSMEIPRKGNLKDLQSVSLWIGSGRPMVAANLQTTPGKNGAWTVRFQLSPELAEKCSVNLMVTGDRPTYLIYAVELKGYMTDRK